MNRHRNFRQLLNCQLLGILMLLGGTSWAQNSFDLDRLNPGEILVNLNANEQVQVEQDTLHAELFYAAQGTDRAELQDEVNQVMSEALEILADSDVEYATHLYRVFQVPANRQTRGGGNNMIWRAQQSVQLTSQDSEALLDLVADLQGMNLTMSNLYYSLSAQRQEEVADSLMATALEKLRNRAEAAADAMNKNGVEIVELSMNSSNDGYVSRRASTAAMGLSTMEVATPVAEPGMTTVMFNVSARVVLLP